MIRTWSCWCNTINKNYFDITFDRVVQMKPMTYRMIIRMSRFVLYHKFKDLTNEITIMTLVAKLLFCPWQRLKVSHKNRMSIAACNNPDLLLKAIKFALCESLQNKEFNINANAIKGAINGRFLGWNIVNFSIRHFEGIMLPEIAFHLNKHFIHKSR